MFKVLRTYKRLDEKCYKETTKCLFLWVIPWSYSEDIYEYDDVYKVAFNKPLEQEQAS